MGNFIWTWVFGVVNWSNIACVLLLKVTDSFSFCSFTKTLDRDPSRYPSIVIATSLMLVRFNTDYENWWVISLSYDAINFYVNVIPLIECGDEVKFVCYSISLNAINWHSGVVPSLTCINDLLYLLYELCSIAAFDHNFNLRLYVEAYSQS